VNVGYFNKPVGKSGGNIYIDTFLQHMSAMFT
jgi:hypothetical protein